MPKGVYIRTKYHIDCLKVPRLGSGGHIQTEETKRKIGLANSIALKGKKQSKEAIKKRFESRKGYKHSLETKKKMREAHIGEKNPMFGKKFTNAHKKKLGDAKRGKMPHSMMRPGKFGNVQRGWFNINGKRMFFRSKWEVNYALYLDFLVKQNEIKRWEYEKDVFIFEKINFGTRSYRPDFKVTNNNGSVEYHEIKGWMTPKSKTQLKRMTKYYPEIKTSFSYSHLLISFCFTKKSRYKA